MTILNKNQLLTVPKRLVYVAGPYWHDNPARRQLHIESARLTGVRVAEAGYMPVIPHCNTAGFESLTGLPESFYHSGDILLLSRCDGMILSPGWTESKGTLGEISYCKQHSIPIFTSIEELNETEW